MFFKKLFALWGEALAPQCLGLEVTVYCDEKRFVKKLPAVAELPDADEFMELHGMKLRVISTTIITFFDFVQVAALQGNANVAQVLENEGWECKI